MLDFFLRLLHRFLYWILRLFRIISEKFIVNDFQISEPKILQNLVSKDSEIKYLKSSILNKEINDFIFSLINHPTGCIILPSQYDAIYNILIMADDKLRCEIKNFLSNLKPQFIVEEIATNNKCINPIVSKYNIKNSDPDRLRIHELALTFMQHNPGLAYPDAIIMAFKSLPSY